MHKLGFRSWMWFILGVGVLLCAACPGTHAELLDGGYGDSGDAVTDASGTDSGLQDSGDSAIGDTDAGTFDAVGQQLCRDEMALDSPIDVDIDGPDTQIHAALAFDGRGLWVTYNLPDSSNGFDVYLTRLACDGQVLLAPFQVNTTDSNDVDPDIAIGDNAIAVVWSPDNGTGTNNMDATYRMFNHDGSPRMASDQTLETRYAGNLVEGNVMSPQVIALPGGGFAITAIRGIPAAAGFQAFVQRLDDDGNLQGAAIDGYVEDGRYDSLPSISASANGDIYWTYVRGGNEMDNEVVQLKIPAGTSTPQPQPPRVVASSSGDSSSFYAAAPSHGQAYLAYAYNSNISLLDGSRFASDVAFVELGVGSGLDYAPRVVAKPGGGVVFWYRNVSGYRNQFLAQGFAFDGSVFNTADQRSVTDAEVPPYAPAATYLFDDYYAVAWSEGSSPAYRVKMSLVQLP